MLWLYAVKQANPKSTGSWLYLMFLELLRWIVQWLCTKRRSIKNVRIVVQSKDIIMIVWVAHLAVGWPGELEKTPAPLISSLESSLMSSCTIDALGLPLDLDLDLIIIHKEAEVTKRTRWFHWLRRYKSCLDQNWLDYMNLVLFLITIVWWKAHDQFWTNPCDCVNTWGIQSLLCRIWPSQTERVYSH